MAWTSDWTEIAQERHSSPQGRLPLCWVKTEQKWLWTTEETQSFLEYRDRGMPWSPYGQGCVPLNPSIYTSVSMILMSISSLKSCWDLSAESVINPQRYRGKWHYNGQLLQAPSKSSWADKYHPWAQVLCGRITYSWELFLIRDLKGTDLYTRCPTASKCLRKERAIPGSKSKHAI